LTFPGLKVEKTIRHINYLLKHHVVEKRLKEAIAGDKEAHLHQLYLMQELEVIKILNLNFPIEILKRESESQVIFCPSHLYIISFIDPSDADIKRAIESVLEERRDIYYPDLRFLVGCFLGIPQRYFEKRLATILEKDRRFRRSLWFYASYAPRGPKDIPSEELIRVVGTIFNKVSYMPHLA